MQSAEGGGQQVCATTLLNLQSLDKCWGVFVTIRFSSAPSLFKQLLCCCCTRIPLPCITLPPPNAPLPPSSSLDTRHTG